MDILQDAAGKVGGIVAEAILENPVTLLAVGVAAIGYGAYCAGAALAGAVAPALSDAGTALDSAYTAVRDEIATWFEPAMPVRAVDRVFEATSREYPPGVARIIPIRDLNS